MRARLRLLAALTFRIVANPFGKRALRRGVADGLPVALHRPLEVLFGADPTARAVQIAATIEARRREIAERPDRYRFELSETPGVRWLVRDDAGEMTADRLARSVSVQPRWGMFLHLCAEAMAAESILEVGTCVGISGAYLAAASSRPSLITLDGSAHLAEIARQTLAAVTDRATVVVGRFDDTLATAVEPLRVQLAYVDGHHDGQATRSYVRTLLPRLSAGALIVLDDIRLHPEMWHAWQEIVRWQGVAAAVDVGRFGLVVWEGGTATATRFDLSRYTGRWPIGASRAASLMRDAART